MVAAEMITIIRIRGSMETRTEVEETLSSHLHLTRKLHCSVFSRDVKGWLQKAKDYITWAPIDPETLSQLVEKRGEVNHKKIDKKDVAQIVAAFAAGQQPIKLFRLHPPVGGFKKSTKAPFPKGELGKRDAESMKKLLLRML
ncbi:MAG: 50S ribosomal protein L30 [Candidatus Micrarchaeota archaeon]